MKQPGKISSELTKLNYFGYRSWRSDCCSLCFYVVRMSISIEDSRRSGPHGRRKIPYQSVDGPWLAKNRNIIEIACQYYCILMTLLVGLQLLIIWANSLYWHRYAKIWEMWTNAENWCIFSCVSSNNVGEQKKKEKKKKNWILYPRVESKFLGSGISILLARIHPTYSSGLLCCDWHPRYCTSGRMELSGPIGISITYNKYPCWAVTVWYPLAERHPAPSCQIQRKQSAFRPKSEDST